jgi:hypothetical protein
MKLVLFLVAALVLWLIVAAGPVRAEWQDNGTPICTYPGWQTIPSVIHDGGDGWFVVWQDRRGVFYDIYAQRITINGDKLWTTTGVPVCTAIGHQEFARAVPDGAGGIIVAWKDGRGVDADIYAQRLDPDGTPMWSQDGEALCLAPADQEWVHLVADGVGGVVAAWHDFRSPGGGIYAQRLDAGGNPLWTPDGVTVCGAPGDQFRPFVMADGANPPIVAWYDGRGDDYDIYAQRVGWDGSMQWAPDGMPVCTAPGDQRFESNFFVQVVTDSAGGAIVVWQDRRAGNWDAYSQRLDPSGNPLWALDGIPIGDEPGDQIKPVALPDGVGGAIVCWEDRRGADVDLYAQRLTSAGVNQWVPGGTRICTAIRDQTNARIVSDGGDGAILTWRDFRPHRGVSDVWTQKIDELGGLLWGTGGKPVCTELNTQAPSDLVSDGAGGGIVVWYDYRTGDYDIYANRIYGSPLSPTLLQEFHAQAKSSHVEIEWRLHEAGSGMEFFVYREAGLASGFREIRGPAISSGGLTYRFEDHDVIGGRTYRYRVDVSDEDGRRVLFETAEITPSVPELTLYQNVPNPFNPSTQIQFYLPREAAVTLDVYDVSGRRINTLFDGTRAGGLHTVEWSGRDAAGNGVSSGIYFYVLRAGNRTLSRKMILVR